MPRRFTTKSLPSQAPDQTAATHGSGEMRTLFTRLFMHPFDRDEFAPDPRAARAYQEINKVYATLTAFTDPLFRSMADRPQGLEGSPGPSRG
jgi:hypothetical protein